MHANVVVPVTTLSTRRTTFTKVMQAAVFTPRSAALVLILVKFASPLGPPCKVLGPQLRVHNALPVGLTLAPLHPLRLALPLLLAA